jgi:hypothetical protein
MDSSVYVGMLLLNRSLERIATALETLATNQNAEIRPKVEKDGVAVRLSPSVPPER